jgi:hypothetical protein
MTIMHKAILRACWQKENEHGMHPPRPWLRRLLTGAVAMKSVPPRESETKKRSGNSGSQCAKTQVSRSIPRPLRCSGTMGRCSTHTGCTTSLTRKNASDAITSPARPKATCGFRFTTCRRQFVIAYGQG